MSKLALLLLVAASPPARADDQGEAVRDEGATAPAATIRGRRSRQRPDIKDPKLARARRARAERAGQGQVSAGRRDRRARAGRHHATSPTARSSRSTTRSSSSSIRSAARRSSPTSTSRSTRKRETLTIETARTVNADGKPHVASKDEIGDIVPPQLADATIYSDVRERVDHVPRRRRGLGPRARVHAHDAGHARLAARRRGDARAVEPGARAHRHDHGADRRHAEVRRRGHEARAEADEPATTHDVDVSRSRTCPIAIPRAARSTDAAVLPRLVYGFQPSWHEGARAGRRALPREGGAVAAARRDQGRGRSRSSPVPTTTPRRRTQLFAFVAHDIRSIELPLGWAGYEPHAPEVVLQNRYGDDRDKVGLLLALAASQSIKGRPVLVRTGKVPVIPSVPTLAQFDRMIAKLDVGGKDVWLDPERRARPVRRRVRRPGQPRPAARQGRRRARLAPGARSVDVSVSHDEGAVHARARTATSTAKYTYELTGWYADRASQQLRPLKGELARSLLPAVKRRACRRRRSTRSTPSATRSRSPGPLTVTHDVSVPGYSSAQAGHARVRAAARHARRRRRRAVGEPVDAQDAAVGRRAAHRARRHHRRRFRRAGRSRTCRRSSTGSAGGRDVLAGLRG